MNDFGEFQKAEYENIVKAHFETVNQVSNFFRYYLLILSVPSAILLLINRQDYSLEKILTGGLPESVKILTASIFVGFSIVGLLLCWYLINLRHDAILYARTVNGIRRYFYESGSNVLKESQGKLEESWIRILPKKISQPRYLELHLFFPVVLTFGVIDSAYLVIGVSVFQPGCLSVYWLAGIFGMFLALHCLVYSYLSYYKDNYYMRSHKIGIDIDGVLNKHRDQFAKILRQVRGKRIDPDEMTEIPVRKSTSLGVTEQDEHYVFNRPEYWLDMPPIQDSFRELEKIRTSLGYKIYVFSWRPWPDLSLVEDQDKQEVELVWKKIRMREITKEWLRRHKIPFNKLILEKGGVNASDTTFWFLRRNRTVSKNRYQISRRKNIRYFVEDDPEIAAKLSYICDYVFLISQPYNVSTSFKFQSNVIRVQSWSKILEHLRSLA